MIEPATCSGGRHLAPRTGGSCPCGLVTRIPAPRRPSAGPPPEVLALLTQFLGNETGAVDAATSSLLPERADRLLSALATAGLVISVGTGERLSA